MKRVALIFFIFIFLSVSLISADVHEDFSQFCQNVNLSMFEDFNVPSFVPYQDEIFNFYIIEENLSGSFEISKGKVTSLSCEENGNMTYNVYIDKFSTIEEISESENSFGTYNEKVASGQIEIKGATFGKRLKIAFTEFVLKIISWFR